MMNDFCAANIGEGCAIGRPKDAVDADVVVRGGGLGSVGEPANDQIAGVGPSSPSAELAADKSNALAIGRGNEIAVRIRLAPDRLGRAASDGRPATDRRRAGSRRCRRPRSRKRHRLGLLEKEVIGTGVPCRRRWRRRDCDVRAVPDKGDMLAIGRPDGIGRMLDVDQLLDSECGFARAGLSACASRAGEDKQRRQRVR